MRWGRLQEEEVGAEYQELIVGHVKLEGTVGLTWWFPVGSWMQSGIQGRGLGWGYKSGCHLHVNGIRSDWLEEVRGNSFSGMQEGKEQHVIMKK